MISGIFQLKGKYQYLTVLLVTGFLFSCMKDMDNTGDIGTGGSMARFTIRGNYLYTVDNEDLRTFNISDSTDVSLVNKTSLGFGIETIFPVENLLFMGARNGMHIYDISNPELPQKKSFTPHFVGYDPVVVQGKYAYVTLRSALGFGEGRNVLLVFDISIPQQPALLAEYTMMGPRGLGIDENKLFVCDDKLKVFEVKNGVELKQLHSFDIPAIDVIPHKDVLYVVAEDGFYQYSYSGNNIILLSKITLPPRNL